MFHADPESVFAAAVRSGLSIIHTQTPSGFRATDGCGRLRPSLPLAIVLLAALPACGRAPEPDVRRASASLAEDASVLEEPVCRESASPPLVKIGWSFDTAAVVQRSAHSPVQLGLEAREDLTVDLRLVSAGLDNRTVFREYGSYALSAGQPIAVQVVLADLPLQAVSHSATGSVEVTITRNDGTKVTMHSPPFYHHFSSNYGTILTYPYDAMIGQFHGGQISQDPSEVEGRVYIDGQWRDIVQQRLLEYQLPVPFAPPIDAFVPEVIGLPPGGPSFGQRLCVDWQTQFLDVAHGEDFVATRGVQTVDASYAIVTIEKVADFNSCIANTPGVCGNVVWEGPLDDVGCTYVSNSTVGDHYYVWLHGQFIKDFDGVPTIARIYWHKDGEIISPPPLPPSIRLSVVHLPEGLGSPYHPFEPPYLEVDSGQDDHVFVIWREWQNAAAVMSLLFKTQFVTYASGYMVHANVGCPTGTPGVSSNDACAVGNSIYVGSWTVEVGGGSFLRWTWPGLLQYKYIIAHEAGHAVMRNGFGWPRNDYTYNGTLQGSCRCDHVAGANQLHCLQSTEYASAPPRWRASDISSPQVSSMTQEVPTALSTTTRSSARTTAR